MRFARFSAAKVFAKLRARLDDLIIPDMILGNEIADDAAIVLFD